MSANKVWIRNPQADGEEVYVLGELVGEADGSDVTVKMDKGGSATIDREQVFTANPDGLVCPDNTMLIHLSEATLLANLRSRYQSKDIYTLTGSILLVSAHHDTRRYCLALPSTRTSLTRASLAPRIRAAAPTRMLCVEKIVCRRR